MNEPITPMQLIQQARAFVAEHLRKPGLGKKLNELRRQNPTLHSLVIVELADRDED